MRGLMTLRERKLAARLLLVELRKARSRGIWSDGNKLFRGAEIDELLQKLTHRLTNDLGETRQKPHRFSNAHSTLALIRKNPTIHRLPATIPEMLAARAQNSYRSAVSGTPGSADTFLYARRLARRQGSLGAHDLPFGREVEKLAARFERPTAVLLTQPHAFREGDEQDLPAGTRLFGEGDDFWHLPNGVCARIESSHLSAEGARPARLRHSERRALGLAGPVSHGSGPAMT